MLHKNSNKSVDYEFVTAATEKADPKIINEGNDNDPLHVIGSTKINSFDKKLGRSYSALADASQNAQKFVWFPKATKFFLRRCLNKKEKFRNSKIEKRVWTEILEEMNSAGFHVENEEILFHKLKNMKRNYRIYNDKHKISKGTGRIIWPYFHILKELFFKASVVNNRRRRSFFEGETIDDSQFMSDSSTVTQVTNDKRQFKRLNTLHYLRKKQQRIKEKKEEMAEKIIETLKETNKLQEERNNLILELISIKNSAWTPKDSVAIKRSASS